MTPRQSSKPHSPSLSLLCVGSLWQSLTFAVLEVQDCLAVARSCIVQTVATHHRKALQSSSGWPAACSETGSFAPSCPSLQLLAASIIQLRDHGNCVCNAALLGQSVPRSGLRELCYVVHPQPHPVLLKRRTIRREGNCRTHVPVVA